MTWKLVAGWIYFYMTPGTETIFIKFIIDNISFLLKIGQQKSLQESASLGTLTIAIGMD